ncbi:MAG: IS3 family transposase [Candidatus Eisenbacteria bacterium]|uniref:IS3 family transposase n=1 Tax=Eiseniibacteriota bacterium TaxID=2212470 RepID=A0A7Y2H3J3_UNCEI|nr:IS3 family transposase [Candidatus Eisenbacteria bacterium]
MVSASAKRQAVRRVVEEGVCSERRACRYLGLRRSSCQYRSQEAPEATKKLVKRILWLSRKYPRYGYRRIRGLLLREGWKAGRKFVQRIRRLEGLGIKGRGPRRRRRGHSTATPTRATQLNEVWSWDFVHDRTDNGASLKMLTLIDEYSRQCLKITPARRLRSKDVLDALAEAMAERGVPTYIRSDNGSEFIAKDVQDWVREMGIGTIYIDPGSPWQNPFVESFHNRLRDECLNQECFSAWQRRGS